MTPAFNPIAPDTWRWAKEAHYSQAVRVGPLVLTCGVAPLDIDGRLVGIGDFDVQCRTTIENVSTLLEAAGSSFDLIVRQHVFLRRRRDVKRYRELRSELFSPPYPASVLLVVTEHAHPDMLIEISCEALARE